MILRNKHPIFPLVGLIVVCLIIGAMILLKVTWPSDRAAYDPPKINANLYCSDGTVVTGCEVVEIIKLLKDERCKITVVTLAQSTQVYNFDGTELIGSYEEKSADMNDRINPAGLFLVKVDNESSITFMQQ